MTQKLNKERWLLCDEQRFISGEISHQTKRGPATSTKGLLWGGGGGKKCYKSPFLRG